MKEKTKVQNSIINISAHFPSWLIWSQLIILSRALHPKFSCNLNSNIKHIKQRTQTFPNHKLNLKLVSYLHKYLRERERERERERVKALSWQLIKTIRYKTIEKIKNIHTNTCMFDCHYQYNANIGCRTKSHLTGYIPDVSEKNIPSTPWHPFQMQPHKEWN